MTPTPDRAATSALEPWLARVDLTDLATPVLVACSGGADSLALLALIAHAGLPCVAVHVDHGLRPGSATEAEVVRAAAARFGVPFEARAVHVAPGPNLEARARDARYAALRSAATAHGAGCIAVAHTADDQAETVLLNLLRGAATTGLSGMAPRRADISRPLLALRRTDTETICAVLGLEPVQDPSNQDRAFLRNRIRLDLIPELNDMAARDIVPLLARQAEMLRTEDAFLDALAAAAWPAPEDPDPARPLVAPLRALDPVLARRAVRRWLGGPPASAGDVEEVLAVARGERRACELAGRGRIDRSAGRLRRAERM